MDVRVSTRASRTIYQAGAWFYQAGAWFLVALMLIVNVERRVAELDLKTDTSLAIENDEELDGSEILDRLVGIDDIRIPGPLPAGVLTASTVLQIIPALLPCRGVDTRTPRAPPALPSSPLRVSA